MTNNRSWLRNVLTTGETTQPVEVYRRTIADYADDIANGKRLVAIKSQELASAQDQLRLATEAFIRHCAEIDLPIEMEPTSWPTKPYTLED